MDTVVSLADLKSAVHHWKRQGLSIALVPTMGNLHAGHYALIKAARDHADRVVATVFVNPTQFGEGEDFESYPRTLEADQRGLADHGCDLLYAPPVEDMYPSEPPRATVHVPVVSDGLCGARRPGHFDGVATVVLKLLNRVLPDCALFGEKDYQQLMVLRKMVADLDVPTDVIGVPTVRESDGLAMSSRNQYLTPAERRVAGSLHAALERCVLAIKSGRSVDKSIDAEKKKLARNGFRVDYFELRRASDLAPISRAAQENVLLVAARLGSARLIDNMRFKCEPDTDA